MQELRDGIQEQAVVSANEILEELKKVAFSDVSGLMEWSDDGVTVKDSKRLPPELTSVISEVTEIKHKDGSSTVKIKLYDKMAALDKLAKIGGFYRDDRREKESAPITQITVVLNHSSGQRTTETRQLEAPESLPPGTVDGQVLGVDAGGPDAAAGDG